MPIILKTWATVMTMFKDDERIISSDDNVIDVDVICAYLEEGLGGKVPG